jgi:hypothetical protein
MNSEYIQNLRYKLQKRVRRLNSTPLNAYQTNLQQLWHFFHSHPIFAGLAQLLVSKHPTMAGPAQLLAAQTQAHTCKTELEHAAFSYFVLKECVESPSAKTAPCLMAAYGYRSSLSDGLTAFNEHFLEPFYDYVDEQLDDRGATLAMLRRYKHKVEWFCGEQLFGFVQSDSQHGEKKLALHLYEYLHDQGIDFFIEPKSVSGQADLVGAQTGAEPLIADAKIFCPDKGKNTRYIAHGFNQVYIYTLNYNQPFGFLIIYNASGEDLRFALADKSQSVPFLTHNNKTIFFIVIDIFPHETSASKRGQLKTHEITEELLISVTSAQTDSVVTPDAKS